MERNLVDVGLDKIDAFLKATGMPESRLGLLACANARAVARVRNGTATVETLRAIVDYIDRLDASEKSRERKGKK